MKTDKFEAYLTTHGLSRTKPRRLAFRVLALNGPLKLPAVVEALSGQVDRATVYRTVDFFLANAIAVRTGQDIELGDAFKPHHHHLVCNNCGYSVSIDDATLETQLAGVADRHGFQLSSHQVELSGLCERCQHSQVV
jgi:Fur family ferric uptake transcriptional regulator